MHPGKRTRVLTRDTVTTKCMYISVRKTKPASTLAVSHASQFTHRLKSREAGGIFIRSNTIFNTACYHFLCRSMVHAMKKCQAVALRSSFSFSLRDSFYTEARAAGGKSRLASPTPVPLRFPHSVTITPSPPNVFSPLYAMYRNPSSSLCSS